ncbi:MAG: NADH-quinone oxidoreductase subunit A [Thermoleophilia bacterium]
MPEPRGMPDFPRAPRLQLIHYLPIAIFLAFGLIAGLGQVMLNKIWRRKPNPVKGLPYESGILPTNPVRQRFSIDYYLTAMLFIVFDIELAFIYPLVVVLRDSHIAALVTLLSFVATVVVALVYVWRKGALEWR